MLETITTFALATHEGEYADWPLTTALLREGVPTGQYVPGYVIEGQYRWGEHVLLINSWDCPFEESYDFLLLDATCRIIAQQQLGVPYGTYLLHAHWPLTNESLRLHFYEADCFTLSIVPPSGWWHRRHRLRLTHHRLTPGDERTQASIRTLQERLEQTATRTDTTQPPS